MIQYPLCALIVLVTMRVMMVLHRHFPAPRPYDWPEWYYRAYFAFFALVHRRKSSWRAAL